MKPTANRAPRASGLLSVVEKTLKVRATLDYGPRPLLQGEVHAVEERNSDPNVHTFSRKRFSTLPGCFSRTSFILSHSAPPPLPLSPPPHRLADKR